MSWDGLDKEIWLECGRRRRCCLIIHSFGFISSDISRKLWVPWSSGWALTYPFARWSLFRCAGEDSQCAPLSPPPSPGTHECAGGRLHLAIFPVRSGTMAAACDVPLALCLPQSHGMAMTQQPSVLSRPALLSGTLGCLEAGLLHCPHLVPA